MSEFEVDDDIITAEIDVEAGDYLEVTLSSPDRETDGSIGFVTPEGTVLGKALRDLPKSGDSASDFRIILPFKKQLLELDIADAYVMGPSDTIPPSGKKRKPRKGYLRNVIVVNAIDPDDYRCQLELHAKDGSFKWKGSVQLSADSGGKTLRGGIDLPFKAES